MGYRRLLKGGFVVLLGGHLAGCGEPAAVVDPDISKGEAVLAALEHVAALKWGGGSTLLVEGKLAVAHDGEERCPSPHADSWTVSLRRAAGGGPRAIR